MNGAPLWWVIFCVVAVAVVAGLGAWMLLHQDDTY